MTEDEPIAIHIESDQEYLERVAVIEGEPETVEEIEHTTTITDTVVTYTDPLGVVFEAPVVGPENFMDDFTEEEVAEVEEAKETLEVSTEWDSVIVSDPIIINILQNEINNIFGYEVEIEVFEDGENYNIVTGDSQEVTVPIDYVNNLK